MALLEIFCPSCRTRLRIDEQHVGRRVRCPTCAHEFSAAQAPVASRGDFWPAPPRPHRPEQDFDEAPGRRRLPEHEEDVARPRRPSRAADGDIYSLRRPLENDYDEPPRYVPPPRPSPAWDDEDDFYPRPRRRKRTNPALMIGMIAGGGLLLVGLIIVIVLVVGAISDRLPGTTWVGNEDLAGFGRLEFQFKAKDECVMVDARSQVRGAFTRSGNKVAIRFGDVVYEGDINGRTMSGTARGVQGNLRGAQWSWQVTRK